MVVPRQDAELRGLIRAAREAGQLDTFRAAVRSNTATPQQLVQSDSAPTNADTVEKIVEWLTDDELVELAVAHREPSVVIALYNSRIHHSRNRAERDLLAAFDDRAAWELADIAGSECAGAHLIFTASRAAQVARSAIENQWRGRYAGLVLGQAIAGTPTARQLFNQTVHHTPATLTMFAAADVRPDARTAVAFADGALTFTSEPRNWSKPAQQMYGAMLWFAATISDTARIDPGLADAWYEQLSDTSHPDPVDVVLPADWRHGDTTVTERAANVVLEAALRANERLSDSVVAWLGRAAQKMRDDTLATSVAMFSASEITRIALHAPAPQAATLIKECLIDELIASRNEDPEAVADLVAATLDGAVPYALRLDLHDDSVGKQLCRRLIAAAAGTPEGFQILAGLAPSWTGTTDALVDTVAALAERPERMPPDTPTAPSTT